MTTPSPDTAFEAALPEPERRTHKINLGLRYGIIDGVWIGYTAEQMRAMFQAGWTARGEADAWQPIETAPRNSSRVLVAYKSEIRGWRVVEAWWRMPYEAAPLDRCWWCHDGNSTLLDKSVHGLGATHWMPLPAPPLSGE